MNTQNRMSQEEAIRKFLRVCMDYTKDEGAMDLILAYLGEYYGADRSYIFVFNGESKETGDVYEWCRHDIASGEDVLRHISSEDMECLIKVFEEKGEFFVRFSDKEKDSDSISNPILDMQEIHSFMAAPLILHDRIVGFLGICNPCRCTEHLLLLTVAASSCYSEIRDRQPKNPNNETSVQIPEDRMKIIQSLSEIYTSAYFIDIEKNYFTEISSVSQVHTHIGASGDAKERLNYFCHHMVMPEYTDEMLEFINLSTLDKRFCKTRILSKQYRSRVFMSEKTGNWMECCFIESDRDEDGRLAHVIFATQSIHEAKVRELEAQEKLQKTNDELAGLLKAEKQHTAIISALSNIFFALYFIDLEKNSFQELIQLDSLHHVYSQKGNARYALKTLVETLVSDEYRPAMRIFTDFDTIDMRLKEQNIIIQEYVPSSGGWARCSFIPVERDSEGKNLKVLCTLRNITADKKAVETQDNLIQALAISYENVYAVNMDTVEAVCYRMGQAMSERYGKKFAIGNYEENIRSYIDNDVLEEDRYLFDAICSVENVRELLRDKQAYYFNYRVFRNNKEEYYQCQIVKPDNERNEFAVAFKNIDAEKRLELVQQKKIKDALEYVEKINETLQDEMEIAGALSKEYPNVVLLDLAKDTSTIIKVDGKIIEKEKRVSKRSYEAAWDDFIKKYVLEKDQENLKASVSIPAVQRALEDSDEYICTYRTIYDNTGIHHFQAAFMRTYSYRTAESQIILGFRNVDNIVEEERKHTKIQEEQLRIIGALSREYHSLFKINSRTSKMTLYRTDGIGMETQQLNKLMELEDYEAVLDKYIDHYVVPEDRDRIREATTLNVLMKRVPETGLYKLGYRRNMNGIISYYEMNIVKTVDENGTAIFILGLRDVSDEMQKKLKQARDIEEQSEIIEGLGSEYYSVLLVDPERDRVTTYRAIDEDGQEIEEHFRRHNGCWSKGIRSYSEEMVSEESRGEFIDKLSLEHIRADGEAYSFTYEKLIDGGIVYLQARVAFVEEKDGRFVAVVGTRNVDDLIKKERQQEMALQAAFDAAEAANKAKTDFLSNMSHDIRTPMNGIIGMTAIAATHIDDKERVRDCLQKITQASKHLLSLINEVLDMSKIESGKVDLNEEEFNLSDLIDNLLTMTSSQIEKHHHELSVNISGVVHEAVVGDSLRIQKIFTNLMSNAVKFTPDGGKIQLSISEKPSNQEKVGCYEFIFEDNGMGMSEEFLDQIFEPFSRASDGRVNRIQGTGLGMPISRNIVRMMGGDIKVESTFGKGSRFTVTIYLKLQENVELHYDKFIDLDVLVADDDTLSLESCCGILNDFGMRAKGVSSGREAVASVVEHHEQKRDYFACIIDWKMPDMDGIETTKAIRKAVGKGVPIIIISAYDWSDIEQEARAAGANAFISKPLFRSRLAKTFNMLVGEEDTKEQETPFVDLDQMDFTGRRALLVEDNELNAEIATEILEMTGLAVEHAADGAEAVDKMSGCEDGYYNIIFMDIQMPNMNGYDATRVIRAMDRNYCRQVPIVAMTANAFAEDVLAAKTVGMNEHIAKPLDLKALAKTLNRWL